MSDAAPSAEAHFKIVCPNCQRTILARGGWIARDVECPHCHSAMRVPEPGADQKPVRASAPSLSAKHYFNFACGRCDSLLESHSGISGRQGSCPTCGATFVVPFIDPRTKMPDAPTMLTGDGENPTPMHAYATSGVQAPRIVEAADGTSAIECPRCQTYNEVDAEHCAACGVPFTLEGATTGSAGVQHGLGTAALVVGIFAIPMFFAILPGLAAVVLGLLGLRGGYGRRKSVAAIVGTILGVISLGGAAALYALG